MPPPVSRERIVPGLKAKLGQELQQSSKRRGESCDSMQRGGIMTSYYAYIVLGWLVLDNNNTREEAGSRQAGRGH